MNGYRNIQIHHKNSTYLYSIFPEQRKTSEILPAVQFFPFGGPPIADPCFKPSISYGYKHNKYYEQFSFIINFELRLAMRYDDNINCTLIICIHSNLSSRFSPINSKKKIYIIKVFEYKTKKKKCFFTNTAVFDTYFDILIRFLFLFFIPPTPPCRCAIFRLLQWPKG